MLTHLVTKFVDHATAFADNSAGPLRWDEESMEDGVMTR